MSTALKVSASDRYLKGRTRDGLAARAASRSKAEALTGDDSVKSFLGET